ncbi:acyl-CoA synthetase MbcS [Salsuginibacillus kocurii]|uniref:acyl-CoA synthetase MbcS n=1 Tax=Salsuginibacillus kocurii TaxID=427078 RepID=UPI0003610487|nr:acyl--CoA ligase [Salsuginibacillus kocurii]
MNRNDLIAPEIYNVTSEMESLSIEGEQTAIRWLNEHSKRRSLSYSQLTEEMNRYANVLTRAGLNKGERVLIILPRLPEAYIVYLACLKAGLVAVPCSEMLRAKDLDYRMHHSEAKAIIAYHSAINEINQMEDGSIEYYFIVGQDRHNWARLETLAQAEETTFETVSTHREDIAFLSYTSGTTGNPKGVVHSHGWGYAHLRTAAKGWLDVRSKDVVWATAAPGWQKWIWSPFLSTIMLGATAFVYHGPFNAHTYLKLLQDEQINVLCCTPTEYRLMAKVDQLSSYKLEHLRSTVSAGEPLNRPVIEAFKTAFNLDVRDGYGQTENTLLVGTQLDMTVKPGSMGKPTPGNDVEIIDENGEVVNVNEVGDIAVHKDAPALFQHYYKEPEKTKATYRGDWYLTGDLASKDEDGYFWFEGRSDDIIISSGYTIGPFEVEDALTKHDAVQECAVVGAPDEVRGNIVKAYVVLKKRNNKVNEEELIHILQEHTKKWTAPYKYPRKIEFVHELPKTNSGKIRRVELRQREREQSNV